MNFVRAATKQNQMLTFLAKVTNILLTVNYCFFYMHNVKTHVLLAPTTSNRILLNILTVSVMEAK